MLKLLLVIPIGLLHRFAVLPHLSVYLSLSLVFFCFVVGVWLGFFCIISGQNHFLFRVYTAPLELQSMTKDKDNRIIANDRSLRSNYCGGSNYCLSFWRKNLGLFYLFLLSTTKRWQHFTQHPCVSLTTVYRLQLYTLSEMKQKMQLLIK